MKRRDFLTAAAVVVVATPALAQGQGFADVFVEQLKGQGFARIEISRTWLGRLRIEAQNDRFRREIILNPRTGEVLRDLWVNLSSGQVGSGLYNPDDEEDNLSRSGGSGDDEEGDDEEDDEEDDDEEDDDEEDDDEEDDDEEDDE